MICKNCQADFDDNLPKCPFCGAFHYAGARKEYMGKLEDMKEDLDDLHETIPQMYTSELKTQAKGVRKILLILAGIFTILILFFIINRFLLDSIGSRDEKAFLLFTKEAYPVADEFYASGDYEGLLNFYHTSIEENENADFYNWDHYPFLMCFENMSIFRESASRLGTKEFSDLDLQEIFYCYLSSRYYQKGYPMESSDQQLVSSFEDEMEEVIHQLQLTDEEQKGLNDLLSAGEYPSLKDIEDFSSRVYQRLYQEDSL